MERKYFSIDGLQNYLVFKLFRKKCQPNKYANNTELTKGADSIYTWRSWTDRSLRRNVIIFWVDNSSSVLSDCRNKNIFVLAEGPTERWHNTAITEEAKYCINFTESGKRFVSSLNNFLM